MPTPSVETVAPAEPKYIPQDDGSYEDAVANMPDLDADDPKDIDDATGIKRTEALQRGEDGKFKAKEGEEVDADKAAAKAKDVDDGKKPEAEEEEPADFIEFPPEKEGEEAKRVPLDEVLSTYHKATELASELEAARAAAARPSLPHEVESKIAELHTERTRYLKAGEQFLALNRPQAPSRDMINPASPQYNPELYHAHLQDFERRMGAHQEITNHLKAVEAQQSEEEQALQAQRISRERARLEQFWPEIKNAETAKAVKADLGKHYGLDDETISSVTDSRFYALAKDALAYRASAGKQAEAVKAVKAKPKLIRGEARSRPTKSAQIAGSYSKAAKSGSLEDAADALEGLL